MNFRQCAEGSAHHCPLEQGNLHETGGNATQDWHLGCKLYALAAVRASPQIERGKLGRKSCGMLSRCANSRCSKPFLRLGEGRLFLVDTQCGVKSGIPTAPALRRPRRSVQYFWLCDRCASTWTLIQNGTQGVELVAFTGAEVSSVRVPAIKA